MREFSSIASNWRSDEKRRSFFSDNGVPVAAEIDTRALVRHLRTRGVMRGVLGQRGRDTELIDARAQPFHDGAGFGHARFHTANTTHGISRWNPVRHPSRCREWSPGATWWPTITGSSEIFCDVWSRWARVTVVPALTSAEDVLSLKPDGVFLSNGPGDPEPLRHQAAQVRKLIGKKPMFGICLGHQILGLALGGKTYKLKFGHRGANHPVLNQVTQKVEITSHNHGFAVDPDSLKDNEVELTHINLNDQTLEGFRHRSEPVFCVQYHPEAAPGPHDSHYLFDDFMKLIKTWPQVIRLLFLSYSRPINRMPRRTDIHRILVVGSGPIIIGQACEFDYSGAQACKAFAPTAMRWF